MESLCAEMVEKASMKDVAKNFLHDDLVDAANEATSTGNKEDKADAELLLLRLAKTLEKSAAVDSPSSSLPSPNHSTTALSQPHLVNASSTASAAAASSSPAAAPHPPPPPPRANGTSRTAADQASIAAFASVSPEIVNDSVRRITFDSASVADASPVDHLIPPSLIHFFPSFMIDDRPTIDSFVRGKIDLLKSSGRSDFQALSTGNFVIKNCLPKSCWILEFIADRLDIIYKKNAFDCDALKKMSSGKESPAKLQQAFAKIATLLGQVLRTFCILCLDMHPSKSNHVWAILHDAKRRTLMRDATMPLNDEEESQVTKATQEAIKSYCNAMPASVETSVSAIDSLYAELEAENVERLSRLVYTSEEALQAISCPIFVSMFCNVVNRLCNSPKTKINVQKGFRILINWACQRSRLTISNIEIRAKSSSQSSQSSYYASSTEPTPVDPTWLETSLKVITGHHLSHSAAASMNKARQQSHSDLVTLNMRLAHENLPHFFGRALEKLRHLANEISSLLDVHLVPPSPNERKPSHISLKHIPCLETSQSCKALRAPIDNFQTILALCVLVLSGGQRLQVLHIMSLRNIKFNTDVRSFCFYPDTSEKKVREASLRHSFSTERVHLGVDWNFSPFNHVRNPLCKS